MAQLTGLGRLHAPDPRDRKYLLPKRTLRELPRKRVWFSPPALDQGATPQCVGYAGWGWLASGPVVNKPSFMPTDLYRMAQENDEWPGTDYQGSSTRGLFKALQKLGFVSEYRWAFDAETLVAHVLAVGPVCVGTSWKREMFTPDRWGFIEAKGPDDGGHEWLIVGADRDRNCPDGSVGAARMKNSWGPKWASTAGPGSPSRTSSGSSRRTARHARRRRCGGGVNAGWPSDGLSLAAELFVQARSARGR